MIDLRKLSKKTIGIGVFSLVGLSLSLCILVLILGKSSSKSSPLIEKEKILSQFKVPKWINHENPEEMKNAFIADNNSDNETIYICRANHGFEVFSIDIELIPGVFDPVRKICTISTGQSAYEYTKFEVLTVADESSLMWIQCSNGELPLGSVVSGISVTDDEVPIAKLHHKGTTWIGRVQIRDHEAYATFDGAQVIQPYYHILSLRDISL